MKESKYNITIKEDFTKKLLYNSFSKSIIEINKDVLEQAIKLYDNSNSIHREIMKNGFILDESIDEEGIIEFLYKKSFFNSDKLNIILVPSLKCNLKCPYCFEDSHKHINQDEYFYIAFKKFAIKYFKNFKHVNISFFGGEPLLEFKKLEKIMEYLIKLSYDYSFDLGTSITTNGTLINKKILNKLVSYNCKTIQITLDGNKKSHNLTRKYKNGLGTFDKLIKIINCEMNSYIMNEDFKFILRVNLMNNTVGEIKETLAQIKKELRKEIHIVLRPIYNTDNFNENNYNKFDNIEGYYNIAYNLGFQIMKNNYFSRSCEACGDDNFFYLTPDLNVWKCINNMNYREAMIGKINKHGDYILNLNKISNWYLAADCFRDDDCKSCKLIPDCYGGCILYKIINGTRNCSAFELVSLPNFYD